MAARTTSLDKESWSVQLELLSYNRLRGPMARRLTTNQEIPGSTPGVIIIFADIWHVDNPWSM